MNSKYYYRLLNEETRLRKMLTPVKIKPGYSLVEKEYARCYHILVHAELETYFESVIRHTINATLFEWRYKKVAKPTIKALLQQKQVKIDTMIVDIITTYQAGTDPVENVIKRKSLNDFNQSINSCFNKIFDEIEANNGIKRKNIDALLLPIGYDIESKFPNLSTQLNQYGGKRGNYAHNSSTIANINSIDPFTMIRETNNLFTEILPFDVDIQNLW